MKAYRWELAGFPILLECDKEDAARIIRHFGMSAKGVTLPVENHKKISFYGLNMKERVIAPVTQLSLVVPGHEIPEIGPETCVALFLDDYKLVNLDDFYRKFQK